ncbi:MAG TPA: LemA family protein [Jiangellaceae bacterium]|nr:LemA family protein [Jiangellaceae bacterium]
MGVWGVVAAAVAVVVAIVVAGYLIMRLRGVQQTVDDSWQQVLLALRRRRDLVVELAETVQAHSRRRADLVERVKDARSVADLPGASPDQQAVAEQELDAALALLEKVVDRSPKVRKQPDVVVIRERLADAERRIQARRAVYEDGANALHLMAEAPRFRWLAGPLGIARNDQPVEDEQAPDQV